jgi:hypothetical protein
MTSTVSRRASLKTIAAIGAAGAAVALGGAVAAAPAEAAQPLMADALKDLQAARAVLAAAAHDKAGHRVKAIGLIDAAIVQVKAGMVAGAM